MDLLDKLHNAHSSVVVSATHQMHEPNMQSSAWQLYNVCVAGEAVLRAGEGPLTPG